MNYNNVLVSDSHTGAFVEYNTVGGYKRECGGKWTLHRGGNNERLWKGAEGNVLACCRVWIRCESKGGECE